MEVQKNIHWLAPATMMGTLLFGIVLAAGHHLFYMHLAGTTPPSANVHLLGWNVSGQQINVAIGTALAFLVQSALGTAVSTAYTQLLWRKLRTQPATISDLDVTFGALQRFSAMFRVRHWFRAPFLLVIVLIAWLLPIASVITPATLSVVFTEIFPPLSSIQRVPTLDFASFNFLAPMTYEFRGNTSSLGEYQLSGPSPEVQKVVTAAAAQGVVLPITAPALNSSYDLHFFGPALSCRQLPESQMASVRKNIATATGTVVNGLAYAYLSWAGIYSVDASIEQNLPFYITTDKGGNITDVTYAQTGQFMQEIGSFYMAVMPEIWHSERGWGRSRLEQVILQSNLTVVQCGLANHSYHVSFEYTNGNQYVHIGTDDTADEPITDTIERAWIQAANANTTTKCDWNSFDFVPDPGLNKSDQPEACTFNEMALQSLSYIAVWQAFGSLFLGDIGTFVKDIGSSGYDWLLNTGIVETPLIHTREMQFLQTSHWANTPHLDLQDVIKHSPGDTYTGLYGGGQPPVIESLPEALENLFRNVTVSLMNSPLLQSNSTSRFAPPPTNVTFHKHENIYVYAADKLWLAYGIAISVSALVVAAGLVALFSNGVSFSGSFSTVLRATRHAELSADVRREDTDGRDPLPAYLADATIALKNVPSRHFGSVEYLQVTQDNKTAFTSEVQVR